MEKSHLADAKKDKNEGTKRRWKAGGKKKIGQKSEGRRQIDFGHLNFDNSNLFVI
jgi:hypothetical protein